MLFSAYGLRGARVHATDGAIGAIHDLYFNDANWKVRYVVVDTGGWLSGRRVLVAPDVVAEPRTLWPSQITVDLTRRQIESSPDIDTDKPVSRQEEERLYERYRWIPYWGPLRIRRGVAAAARAHAYACAVLSKADDASRMSEIDEHARGAGEHDPRLRSAREVTGYSLLARDADIGHVDDFIIDGAVWEVHYLVVDTRTWLPGRKVLISPLWTKEVRWSDRSMHVSLTQDQIRNSPEYDTLRPIEHHYESTLFKHYGQGPYRN